MAEAKAESGSDTSKKSQEAPHPEAEVAPEPAPVPPPPPPPPPEQSVDPEVPFKPYDPNDPTQDPGSPTDSGFPGQLPIPPPTGAAGAYQASFATAAPPIPGAEYLQYLDQLMVKQSVELFQAFTGIETGNKYLVLNSLGQHVYMCAEERNCLCQIFCRGRRSFTFLLADAAGQIVLKIKRPFNCCATITWCPCESCRYYASVEDKSDNVIGYISNLPFCLRPTFGIFDPDKKLLASFQGPWCPCQIPPCCTGDIKYPVIQASDGAEIGSVNKNYGGLIKEVFTSADNFTVTFPVSLPLNMKVLLLGSVFILDMMVYEKKPEGDDQNPM